MKRFVLGALAALVIGAGLGAGLDRSRAGILFKPTTSGGGGCSQATAYLARVSGYDGAHITAATNTICALVTDGVWNMWDGLYFLATDTEANAEVNLKSSSFTLVKHGSPTFVANSGSTGIDANPSTAYYDTQFNPATASTPQFVQNSATLMAWSMTSVQSTVQGWILGAETSVGASSSELEIWSSAGNDTFDVNVALGSSVVFTPAGTASGSWIATRTGASLTKAYHNGTTLTLTNPTQASLAPINANFFVLATNAGSVIAGGPNQIGIFGFGSMFVDDAHALTFHNDICTNWLTPIHGSCPL